MPLDFINMLTQQLHGISGDVSALPPMTLKHMVLLSFPDVSSEYPYTLDNNRLACPMYEYGYAPGLARLSL